jgi:hypothetical protein
MGDNKAKDLLAIATNVIGAKIALAKMDSENAIAMLRPVVGIQIH